MIANGFVSKANILCSVSSERVNSLYLIPVHKEWLYAYFALEQKKGDPKIFLQMF